MSRYTYAQNNFTAGVLGKRVHARTEVDDYKNGVDEMVNFISYRGGGIRLRPGFRVVERLQVLDTDPQLVQFQLESEGILYNLVITQADSGSPFYVATANEYDNPIYKSTQTLGVTSDYVRVFSLNAEPEFLFPQQTSRFNVTVVPPRADTWRLLAAQGRYVLVNTTGNYEPLILLRYNGEWRISEYINTKIILQPQLKAHSAYALGYPYTKNRDAELKLNRLVAGTPTVPPAIPDPNVIEFQIDGPPGYFDASFVDSFMRAVPLGETDEITFYIKSYDGGNTITIVAMDGNQTEWVDTIGTNAWSTSGWNQGRGYPKLVTTFNQRVCFANNFEFPNRMWFTSIEDSFILTINKLIQDGVNDNSGLGYFGDIDNSFAFSMTIASNDVLEIVWMNAQSSLMVGTTTSEYRVEGDSTGFGPLSNSAIIQTHHGSRFIEPQASDRQVLFVSREGHDIKQLGFSNDAKAFVINNLSTLTQGIVTESKSNLTDPDVSIKKIAWLSEDYTCWILLTNGKLIGFIKEDVWNVLSWFTVELNPDLFIEDIHVFKQKDLDKDELRVVARGQNADEFYTAILTQDYIDEEANHYTGVSNEYPLQYRYLDFSSIDHSNGSLNNDIYDDVTGIVTVNGTGVVHDFEKFAYFGPNWGTIVNGSNVYAVPVSFTAGGQIETYRLADSVADGLASNFLLPPAPIGQGVLAGAGFEVIIDRFQLSDHGLEVTVLGDEVGLGYEFDGDYAWDLSDPTRPIVYLNKTYQTINYGYKYKGRVKSLNYESQDIGQYNDMQIMVKRIDRVLFKMNRTYICNVGANDDNIYDMEFPVDFTRTGLNFYTGDIIMDWDSSPGEQQRVILEVEGYGPVGVLGIFIRSFMGVT